MSKGNFVSDFIESIKNSTEGLHAVSVVDIKSGLTLGSYSDGTLDPEVASAFNSEVVKSKLKAIKALGLSDTIDDILISLTTQTHIINCTADGSHMAYVAADAEKSNLAMLRSLVRKGVSDLEKNL